LKDEIKDDLQKAKEEAKKITSELNDAKSCAHESEQKATENREKRAGYAPIPKEEAKAKAAIAKSEKKEKVSAPTKATASPVQE